MLGTGINGDSGDCFFDFSKNSPLNVGLMHAIDLFMGWKKIGQH